MAKKQPEVRKNSRASRRLETETPDIIVNETPKEELNGKSRVLKQLAEKQLREGGAKDSGAMGLDDELSAITKGLHPDQKPNASGKVSKSNKNKKKSKQKKERAEMLKDILSEKIQLSKQRHKKVRNYRDEEN